MFLRLSKEQIENSRQGSNSRSVISARSIVGTHGTPVKTFIGDDISSRPIIVDYQMLKFKWANQIV